MLAQIVKLRDEMKLPIGLDMKKAGAKLPDSHLVDPMAALRQMKFAADKLPLLLRKDKENAQKVRRKIEAAGKSFLSDEFGYKGELSI